MFRKHFGISGSSHPFEFSSCDKPKEGEAWHSGQQQTR